MNKLLILFFTLLNFDVFGQDNLNELARPIVAEGKLLYKSEMASWHGTDLLLKEFRDRSIIGGYFSYTEGDTSRCIFFSKETDPKVLGMVSFDQDLNTSAATINLTDRNFSSLERSLYEIRKLALEEINLDTLFKSYNNTNLNLIPIVNENSKKVYVLTGPTVSGVVVIGNDYLLTFDSDDRLIEKKKLHNNILPIYYEGKEMAGKDIESAMHTHLPETGDFITATDICTLMLYQKYAKWKTHNVVSAKYFNIWNCESNELLVLTMEAMKKITENQDLQKKRRKRK
jgi:hypothetical protein